MEMWILKDKILGFVVAVHSDGRSSIFAIIEGVFSSEK